MKGSSELGEDIDLFHVHFFPQMMVPRRSMLAYRLLGYDLTIAHVGDSFFHDVCGAAAAKVPVVFVAGGIDHQDRGGVTSLEEEMSCLELLGTGADDIVT